MKWYNWVGTAGIVGGLSTCGVNETLFEPEMSEPISQLHETRRKLDNRRTLGVSLRDLASPTVRDSIGTLADRLIVEETRLEKENTEEIAAYTNARGDNDIISMYGMGVFVLSLVSLLGINRVRDIIEDRTLYIEGNRR